MEIKTLKGAEVFNVYCNEIQAAELGFQVETVRAGSEPRGGGWGEGLVTHRGFKMQLRTGPGGTRGEPEPPAWGQHRLGGVCEIHSSFY